MHFAGKDITYIESLIKQDKDSGIWREGGRRVDLRERKGWGIGGNAGQYKTPGKPVKYLVFLCILYSSYKKTFKVTLCRNLSSSV